MFNPFSTARFPWVNPAKLFSKGNKPAAPAPDPQGRGPRPGPPPQAAPAPKSAQSRFIPSMRTRSAPTGPQGGRGSLGSILHQLGEPWLSKMNNAQWAELLRPYGVEVKPGADPAARWQQVKQQFGPKEMNQIFASSARTQQLLEVLQTPPRSARSAAPPAPAGRPQAFGTADLSLQVNSIGVDALQRFSNADWKALLNGCGVKVPLGVDPKERFALLAQLRHSDTRRFASVMVNAETLQRVLTQPAASEQIPRLDKADGRQWAAMLAEQGHRLPPGADPAAAWKRIRATLTDEQVMRALDKHPQLLLGILLKQNGAAGAQRPERPQGTERPNVPPKPERTNGAPPAPAGPKPKSMKNMSTDEAVIELKKRGFTPETAPELRKELLAYRNLMEGAVTKGLFELAEKHSFDPEDLMHGQTLRTLLSATSASRWQE